MALVVLCVVEQRLDAVRSVLSGETVVEVAARSGVARSTLHPGSVGIWRARSRG
jgi:transposase-like protein